MYLVTDAFTAALTKSHRMATRVEVLEDGLVQRVLYPTEGSVIVVRKNAIRRRASITVADRDGDLNPVEAADLLHPLSGREFKVYRGLYVPGSSTPELVPQGVFRIKASKASGTPEGVVVALEGFDRGRRVSRARLTDFHVVSAGTTLGDGILDLVSPSLPVDQAYSFPPEAYATTLPALVFDPQDDRWERARKMAKDSGFDLAFDPEGVLTLYVIRDAATVTPAWTLTDVEGEPKAITEDEKVLDDEGVYNHAVVLGGGVNTTAVIRGEAMDENPASPTYIGSPPGTSDFGDVPIFYSSEFIHDQDQADAAALALLEGRLGALEAYSFSSLVNPALDVEDVVVVHQEDVGVDDRYILDSLTVPLSEESTMAAVTRRRRTPEEE